jgi:DNA-directed RNA polymerase subunit RPC12/RpoP
MSIMAARLFPCPVCGEGLDVRESKRAKPYVVCNRCGVQMFVRVAAGIRKFEKLLADAKAENIWERLRRLEGQYRRKCPKCGKTFWTHDDLIATHWFDGSFMGHKCPESDCDGIARMEH